MIRPLLPARLSERTLVRWRAARNAGRQEELAGRWAGRTSIFDKSPDLAAFLIGALDASTRLNPQSLLSLARERFPKGVRDGTGLLLPLPSWQTIGRFLRTRKVVVDGRA